MTPATATLFAYAVVLAAAGPLSVAAAYHLGRATVRWINRR